MKLIALLLALALQTPQTPAQIRDSIISLVQQLVPDVPPVTTGITTAAALDAALASAQPGAVLLLDPTLVYPAALDLPKSVTLQSTSLPATFVPLRMTLSLPL